MVFMKVSLSPENLILIYIYSLGWGGGKIKKYYKGLYLVTYLLMGSLAE